MRCQDFAQSNEGTDNRNTGLDRDGAIQDAGQHDGAILGECKKKVGRVFEPAKVVTVCYHLAFLEACQLLLGSGKHQVKVDLIRQAGVSTKKTGQLQETFLEDFREEAAEIQSPIAERLFVLAKLNHLAHLRVAEYEVLVAVADVAGHHGVGVLLETCLADKLSFAERNRRLIRHFVGAKLAERAAG